MIKCVLFDFGDTLVDSKSASKVAFDFYMEKLINIFNGKYSLEEIISAKSKTDKEINLVSLKERQSKAHSFYFEKLFLKNLGEASNKELMELVSRAYWDSKIKYTNLFLDTIDLLDYLKKRGIVLGVITNTTSETNRVISKKHNIIDYFDLFIMSHEFGGVKSELNIFKKAMDEINKNRVKKILPSECLMVGNDFEEDTSAKRVGMKTVILTKNVNNKNSKYAIEPDYYIDNLIEIKALLSK